MFLEGSHQSGCGTQTLLKISQKQSTGASLITVSDTTPHRYSPAPPNKDELGLPTASPSEYPCFREVQGLGCRVAKFSVRAFQTPDKQP